MSRKPKHPYRHSGKLAPIRTAEHINADVQAAIEGDNFNQVPTLDRYRRFIALMVQAENDMAGDDMEELKKRTAALAEASAWLDLMETWWKDDAGNDTSLSADDAKRLAFNAVRVGMLLGKAQWRLMEGYAVDALDVAENAARQAEKNKGRGYSPDRKTLLAEMKKAAVAYPSANQKRLCEIVAKKVSTPDRTIGGERLRQLLRDRKISVSDYKPKK
jgi:hypothetical protein